MKFSVTYEIITPESAENGDAKERGYLGENLTLREAVNLYGLGGNSYPLDYPCWFTTYGEINMFSGVEKTRSLHLPETVTGASRMRIARLLGIYGS